MFDTHSIHHSSRIFKEVSFPGFHLSFLEYARGQYLSILRTSFSPTRFPTPRIWSLFADISPQLLDAAVAFAYDSGRLDPCQRAKSLRRLSSRMAVEATDGGATETKRPLTPPADFMDVDMNPQR